MTVPCRTEVPFTSLTWVCRCLCVGGAGVVCVRVRVRVCVCLCVRLWRRGGREGKGGAVVVLTWTLRPWECDLAMTSECTQLGARRLGSLTPGRLRRPTPAHNISVLNADSTPARLKQLADQADSTLPRCDPSPKQKKFHCSLQHAHLWNDLHDFRSLFLNFRDGNINEMHNIALRGAFSWAKLGHLHGLILEQRHEQFCMRSCGSP